MVHDFLEKRERKEGREKEEGNAWNCCKKESEARKKGRKKEKGNPLNQKELKIHCGIKKDLS